MPDAGAIVVAMRPWMLFVLALAAVVVAKLVFQVQVAMAGLRYVGALALILLIILLLRPRSRR